MPDGCNTDAAVHRDTDSINTNDAYLPYQIWVRI